MKKYRLRDFYLRSWLVISIIFCAIYLFSGAEEGYFIALLLEIIYAGVFAIIPTLIYFFLQDKHQTKRIKSVLI